MSGDRATEVIRQLEKRSGESTTGVSEWGWEVVKVETVFQISLTKVNWEKGASWIAAWGNLVGLGRDKEEAKKELSLKLRNVTKSAVAKAEEQLRVRE